MKSKIKNIIVTSLSLFLVQCGIDSDQFINIEMYGVYTSPADATGNGTPQSLVMNLTGVTLLNSDGVQETVLYSGDPIELTIVDRAQLIYQKDMADFEDSTYLQVTATFDVSYQANVKDVGAVSDTLTSGTITYSGAYTVETGKSETFSIKAFWQNILTDSAITSDPTFEMTKN